MLWAYDDNGYLISVDLPEQNRCRVCGTEYIRKIENRKPWQMDMPDVCPVCNHVVSRVRDVAFRNIAC